MIIEGLVTTLDADGQWHVAAMGPIVDGPDFKTLIFRPFPTSQTGRNLVRSREGVFHITDDVLRITKIILGLSPEIPLARATHVQPMLMHDCCRAYEFEIRDVETHGERYRLTADIVEVHRFRDFFGFNRAKHAVLEAAILATRFQIIPADTIDQEFARLKVIVEKTAGPAEREAWSLLDAVRMAT
jgi:uncharacterized protein